MISTRQLIIIINIVFFFVNPATSCNSSSTINVEDKKLNVEELEINEEVDINEYGVNKEHLKFFLIGEEASTSNVNVEYEEVNVDELERNMEELDINEEVDTNEVVDINEYGVNKEHIKYCKMELFTAFRQKNGWDNFLYAFSNLRKAEFDKKRSVHTKATAGYYYELVFVALDMRFQPEFTSPKVYCESYFEDTEDDCLRSIAKMECKAHFSGVVCVKQMYFNWKFIDEELPSVIPVSGTESISDEDLENTITRITDMFPAYTDGRLFIRLSEERLLRDFYRQNEDRREIINRLYSVDTENDTENSSRNSEVDQAYERQIEEDMADACESVYGSRIPYKTLVDEHKRRQNVYKVYVNPYATILLNQLNQSGQFDQEFKESRFRDREEFCTSFLLNYPDYYDYLYKD